VISRLTTSRAHAIPACAHSRLRPWCTHAQSYSGPIGSQVRTRWTRLRRARRLRGWASMWRRSSSARWDIHMPLQHAACSLRTLGRRRLVSLGTAAGAGGAPRGAAYSVQHAARIMHRPMYVTRCAADAMQVLGAHRAVHGDEHAPTIRIALALGASLAAQRRQGATGLCVPPAARCCRHGASRVCCIGCMLRVARRVACTCRHAEAETLLKDWLSVDTAHSHTRVRVPALCL
jgi:hypothetical protein